MVAWQKLVPFVVLAGALAGSGANAAEQARLDSIALDSLLVESAPPDSLGILTLDQALALALRHHPALRSAAWRVRAATLRRQDAGRWPNPTASLDVENFGGNAGGRRRETTLSLGQAIEMGGDRDARSRAAQAIEQLSWTELTSEARQAWAVTAERFLDAWAFQEKLSRLIRSERLAVQAIDAAGERFKAGAGPAVEGVRAEVVHATRQAERVRAEAELASARRRLASQWGAAGWTADSLALEPPVAHAIPEPARLAARLESHPERLRAAAEVALEEARLRELRAARVADLQISGGVRHLDEVNGMTMVAGLSVPLPLWGTPRAGADAGQAEREAAAARLQRVGTHLAEELDGAYRHYRAAVEAYQLIVSRVRPRAEEALRQITTGYRGGRFGSLELLEAQRSVLEADLMWVEATTEAWRAQSSLERLLGEPLERIAEEEGR